MINRRAFLGLVAQVSCLLIPRWAAAQGQELRVTGTFPLTGTGWIVEQIDGRPALRTGGQLSKLPMVSFPASGGILVAGCNKSVASLTHDGGTRLSFTPGWTTLMGCGSRHSQDVRLNAAVQETTTFRQKGDHLWFLDRRGAARLRLKRTNEAVE